MGRINLSIGINATPEDVFEVVSDVEKSPDRLHGYEKVELLTDGPVRVGTKWRETRNMSGKHSVQEWEMTAFDSPKRFSAYCDAEGYDVEWTMGVEAVGDVSRLTLNMTTKPRTFIGKLLTPVELLMASMCKGIVRRDLESTKAYIEQRSSP